MSALRLLAGVTAATLAIVAAPACNWKPATSLVKVASIEPHSGVAGVATTILITGAGFDASASVTIGGKIANVVVVNDRTIQGVTPISVQGTVDVVVTNPDGGRGTLYNGFTFISQAR